MSPAMRKWYKRNEKLIRNVRIVMPYAKAAAARLEQIDRAMAGIKNEKVRKQYYKEQEEKLIQEYEAEMRKLTFRKGNYSSSLSTGKPESLPTKLFQNTEALLLLHSGRVLPVFSDIT
jgi:hypothetical protein